MSSEACAGQELDETLPNWYNSSIMEYHAIDTEKLTCKECGDAYTLCRCRHGVCTKNDDGRCMDCHKELVHNIVPDCEENIPSCGNEIGYPPEDWKYFPGISDKFYRV